MTRLRSSIVVKYVTVFFLSLLAVSTAGIWVGSSLLMDMASLSDDTQVLEALKMGRDNLLQGRNIRQKMLENIASNCIKSGEWPVCDFLGLAKVTVQFVPLGTEGWASDFTYVAKVGEQVYRLEIQWNDLKPSYQAITEVINTHEHLAQVFPRVRESFVVVFSLAVAGVGCLSVVAVYLISRKMRRRVYKLTTYAEQLAKGDLLATTPEGTQGPDEIGLLAASMARMALELYQAQEKLLFTQKMESWQAIARKVAHEIKNPLTPISLVAEQLRRCQKQAEPRLQELLAASSRILDEEAGALGQMVKEFTAFARLPEPQFAGLDIIAVVRDFISRNQWEGGPLYRFNSQVSSCSIMADQGMIMQVLHNLVNNAVRAKDPDRVTLAFDFFSELSPERSPLILEISDDGPGVPEHLQHTLFDAYVTSRSTGEREKGMGLGLTISRKIIADHNGILMLKKTGTHGSVFRIELPMLNIPTAILHPITYPNPYPNPYQNP